MRTYPLKFALCQIHEDTVWRSPVTFDASDERHVRHAVIGTCSADGVTRWAEAEDGEILFGLLGKPVRGSLIEVPIERLEEVRTEYGSKSCAADLAAGLRYARMVERALPIDPAADALVEDFIRRNAKTRGPTRKLAKRPAKEGA